MPYILAEATQTPTQLLKTAQHWWGQLQATVGNAVHGAPQVTTSHTRAAAWQHRARLLTCHSLHTKHAHCRRQVGVDGRHHV